MCPNFPANCRTAWLIAALAVAYFITFPDDLPSILAPLEPLTAAATSILAVSGSLSPWAYATIAVAAVCWTIVRVWGQRKEKAPGSPASQGG